MSVNERNGREISFVSYFKTNKRKMYQHLKMSRVDKELINLAVYAVIDYGPLMKEVHLCAVICHCLTSMTQALMLPADSPGNMFESEQFISHFLPLYFLCGCIASVFYVNLH